MDDDRPIELKLSEAERLLHQQRKLISVLLKSLEIADHQEGTGGGDMTKKWMLYALNEYEASPCPSMLMQTFAFDNKYADEAALRLKDLINSAGRVDEWKDKASHAD